MKVDLKWKNQDHVEATKAGHSTAVIMASDVGEELPLGILNNLKRTRAIFYPWTSTGIVKVNKP